MMTDRESRAAADLKRLKAGWLPTPADLASAPLIEGWYHSTVGEHDEIEVLCGTVIGHPRLGTQPITTSALVWVDIEHGFARTSGRFYRLGKPLGWRPTPAADDETDDARPGPRP